MRTDIQAGKRLSPPLTQAPESEGPYAPASVLEASSRTVLLWLVVLASITIVTVFFRASESGWVPVYNFYIGIYLSSVLAWILRRRLSYLFVSGYLIGFNILVGLSGVFTFGVYSPASVMLPVAIVLCVIFVGLRSALKLAGLVLVCWAGIATVHILRGAPPENLGPLNSSPVEWIIRTVVFFWLAGNLAIPYAAIIRYYRENFALLEERSGELRESEQEFRDLFENAVDCVYRADAEGRVIRISPSVKDLLGYDADALIGKTIADFYVDPEDRGRLLQALGAADTGRAYIEARMRDASGESQLISTNARYWRSGSGEILGINGVARNIEAQRKAENQQQIVQKTEALRVLVGGVAHDINNLLAVILAKAETVAIGDGDAPTEAGEIMRVAKQGSGLTSQLLGFSQPGSLKPRAVVVSSLIEGLRGTLDTSVGTQVGMEFEVSTAEKQVFVDEVQLQSALINLVVNSGHAMPNGGTVRLIAAAKNGSETKSEGVQEKIRISVIDTGVGMTPAVKARATEPFYTTKPTGKGFGLGLSVIDAFAKESGGELVIESTVGAGTSVHIDLPAHVTEKERVNSGAVVDPRSGSPDDEAQKILLIEDSAELRILLSRQLSRLEGFSVTTASVGDAAIALAEAGECFDLVISDISLPGKENGFDVCRRILELCPSQPIIFMTGFSQHELADDDPLAQYESLRKPFEFADLHRAIISALR